MDPEFTISCMRKKEKSDHMVFYDCVLGKKHYDKIKLFEKKGVIQLITVEQFEVSKPEAQNEQPL